MKVDSDPYKVNGVKVSHMADDECRAALKNLIDSYRALLKRHNEYRSKVLKATGIDPQ